MDQATIILKEKLIEKLKSAKEGSSIARGEFTEKADAEAGGEKGLFEKLLLGPGITGDNGVIGVEGSKELEKLRDKMLDAESFVGTYLEELSELLKAPEEAAGGGNSAAASSSGGARRSRSKKSRRGRKNTRSAHKRKQSRKLSRKLSHQHH